MGLNTIIYNYLTTKQINKEEARLFILKEFKGEFSRVLNRRYLPILMVGEDGDGYDLINESFYHIDPEVEKLDFEPEDGDFILFQKKGQHFDSETRLLKKEGKLPRIQKLQIVGTEEILEAHIYDEKSTDDLTTIYENSIRQAKL